MKRQGGAGVAPGRFHTVLTVCQIAMRERLELRPWWTGPHSTGQLSYAYLGILFKPKPHVSTLQTDLGVGLWATVPLTNVATQTTSFLLHTTCLIGLLTKTSLFRLPSPGSDPNNSTLLLRTSHTFHCWDPNPGLLPGTWFYLSSHQISAQILPVHLQDDCWVNHFQRSVVTTSFSTCVIKQLTGPLCIHTLLQWSFVSF